jgi:glucokinase
MSYLLGIDLGGSSVKAVAVTPDGAALARYNESFHPERPMHFAQTIRTLVHRSLAERGALPERIGLAAPGLAAADGRSIAYLPERLPGLVGLVWSDYLSFPQPIPVLNDAHAALLGEVWQGAARGCKNVVLLTLGTGVGGAAMVDGRLLRGHTGKAGHLGHTCLNIDGPPDICATPGSLEDAVGNCTIRQRTEGRFATTHDLIAAHRAGDPAATAVWLRSVKALAGAIASFTNILDPEVVVVGGGIARAGDALFSPLEKFVHQFEWKVCGHEVKIVPAQLGDYAGAFGAADNARQTAPQAKAPRQAG